MTEEQTIGRRLVILLSELKLGITEFASSIGMDGSQFGKILSGKLNITLKQVLEISSKYKVRTGWLIEGEAPIYKNEKSGSWEPDIDLLTLMKKQINDLKINSDRLFSHMSEQSSENADLDLHYPSEDLAEGKKKKAGKS